MKRTMFAWTVSMLVMAAPLLSAQHGGSAPKPTSHGNSSAHAGGSTHGSSPTAHGPSASHATTVKSNSSHGAGHGSTKTTTTGSKRTTTTGSTKTTAGATKPAKTSKSTKTTGTTTTTSPALTPVQQKLQRNTNLASKLQSRLPAGANLNTSAAGFRNLGQFVAAVNVSNNLGIPFAQLKTRMVDQGMSLGQAIQDARPATTDTTAVARHAETEADDMIRTTTATTSTTSTRSPKRSHSGS